MHETRQIFRLQIMSPKAQRKLIHVGQKEMELGFEDLRICSTDNRTSLLFLSEQLTPFTVFIKKKKKRPCGFLFFNYILIFLISIPNITVPPFCPNPIIFNIMLIPFFYFHLSVFLFLSQSSGRLRLLLLLLLIGLLVQCTC